MNLRNQANQPSIWLRHCPPTRSPEVSIKSAQARLRAFSNHELIRTVALNTIKLDS